MNKKTEPETLGEDTNHPSAILTKREKALGYGLVAFALTAPFLFTRTALYFGVSFIDTGEIGDTIGGISAPFIGLVGAFLVYKSFEAQIKANQKQQENHRQQLNLQQSNHDKQIKLIRKEQSLGALSYLFKEIEEIVLKNDRKFHKGAIDHISKNLEEFERLESISGDSESAKEYLKKEESEAAKQIGRAISEISNNIDHLRVLINHLISHREDFQEDPNTTELVNFYTNRTYDVLFKLGYRKLSEKPLADLIQKIQLSPMDIQIYCNSQLKLKSIQKKLGGLSFTSLF